MRSAYVLLVLIYVWKSNAQNVLPIPPCNTRNVAFCGIDLCSNSRCSAFPNAVCAQRGCDGNCEPEFFLNGVKLSEERCNGGCNGGKFTQWFNRDRPSGHGDYETLVDLRKEFPETICSHPTFVDARSVSSGLPHDMVGQDNKANAEQGFWCNNKDNPGACMDYKVRFCCPDVPQCPDDAWTDYFNRDRPSATCDCETMPNLRVEYVGQICEEPTAIDVRLVSNNKPHHTAGQIITHADPERGFRCDNTETQTCLDYKVRFCCPKVPQPTCEKDGWTAWLNADHSSGLGDYEKLASLRKKYPELICDKPTSIDARVRLTHESYLTVNQDIDINADLGLICVNGLNQRCLDYEVRFCCPNHNIPLPKCKNGKWTDFYNRDKPSGKGDYETLEALRELAPEEICPNPTNSDVRVARTGASYLSAAQQVEIDPLKGFYCENAAQSGEFCEDYKIRFCCPNECETPVCKDGDWTRFFDIDDPDNEGDIELIENINIVTGGEVCSVPTEIDVRLLNGDLYTTMNQLVHVSVTEGFACYNSDDQTCCDYKVRFCCPEVVNPGNQIAWCTAWGDPHYTTLDGFAYDFQGESWYDFLSTTELPFGSDLQPFSVWTDNRVCGNAVTCIRRVQIRIYDQLIELLQSNAVTLDGLPLSVPYEDVANQWSIVKLPTNELSLVTNFGLRVLFDGLHTLKVSVTAVYRTYVHGLCGNFNGDVSDEFILRGTEILTENVNLFGNSHAIEPGTPVPDNSPECSIDPLDSNYLGLVETCRAIVSHPCFEGCIDLLQNPTRDQILQACVFDFCFANLPWNVIKTTYSVIELSCIAEGLPVCGNASQVFTDAVCSVGENSYYDECAHPECVPSCSSLITGPVVCPKVCGSGACVCPPGLYADYNNKKCVTLPACLCSIFGNSSGSPFLFDNCTQSCVCGDDGVAQCEDFVCSGDCRGSFCMETCGPLPLTRGLIPLQVPPFYPGQTVNYQCLPGFLMGDGNTTTNECRPDFTWRYSSEDLPYCHFDFL